MILATHDPFLEVIGTLSLKFTTMLKNGKSIKNYKQIKSQELPGHGKTHQVYELQSCVTCDIVLTIHPEMEHENYQHLLKR